MNIVCQISVRENDKLWPGVFAKRTEQQSIGAESADKANLETEG